MIRRGRRCSRFLVSILILGACGGDATTSASGSAGARAELVITADEFDFDSDAYEVEGRWFDLTYVNKGLLTHALVIEGNDEFRIEVEREGAPATATVMLQPGTYSIYCDLAGHRQSGQQASLTVREP